MMLHILPSGPFETNAFLVGTDNGNESILIDAPPNSFEKVDSILKKNDRSLAAVLITHPHFDHIMDAGYFAEQGIPVFSHKDAVSGVENPDTLGLIPNPAGGYPEMKVSRTLDANSRLSLAGFDIVCLEVPGHSDGSLAFHFPSENICFVGDLIFRSSIGRTDLPGGNFETLAESIRKKIYTMNDSVILYPGHGQSTTVGDEKQSNPFVRFS